MKSWLLIALILSGLMIGLCLDDLLHFMYKGVRPQSFRERTHETWDIGPMGATDLSAVSQRDLADQPRFSPSISDFQ